MQFLIVFAAALACAIADPQFTYTTLQQGYPLTTGYTGYTGYTGVVPAVGYTGVTPYTTPVAYSGLTYPVGTYPTGYYPVESKDKVELKTRMRRDVVAYAPPLVKDTYNYKVYNPTAYNPVTYPYGYSGFTYPSSYVHY